VTSGDLALAQCSWGAVMARRGPHRGREAADLLIRTYDR